MEILYWGRTSPKKVDEYLQRERERRVYSAETHKEFIIVYEPTEALSIQRDANLQGIRKETEREFQEYMKRNNVPIITTKRGGGIIWHGPGQVCLAPLVNVKHRCISASTYSKVLEESCVKTLEHFGVKAIRNHYHKGSQGAWVVDKEGTKKKIAFFGWSESRGIAIHGCAINVSCDLTPFFFIDPCNLPGVQATSIKEILGGAPSIDEVADVLVKIFIKVLYESVGKEKSGP